MRKQLSMQISDAESRVMEFLWQHHPATAAQVHEALGPVHDWREATVKTLLNRLLGKGAVEVEQDGRRYLYRPAIDRDDWVIEETAGLVDRMFGGRLAPLVAHFSQHRELSPADIEELRRLIREFDDEY